jgi:hypothetical protein
MTIWAVLAFAGVAAAVLALLAPHGGTSSLETLRLFRLQAVDSAATRRAATRAVTPIAAMAIGVSMVGLVANGADQAQGQHP